VHQLRFSKGCPKGSNRGKTIQLWLTLFKVWMMNFHASKTGKLREFHLYHLCFRFFHLVYRVLNLCVNCTVVVRPSTSDRTERSRFYFGCVPIIPYNRRCISGLWSKILAIASPCPELRSMSINFWRLVMCPIYIIYNA
jgi:hypothetical protein